MRVVHAHAHTVGIGRRCEVVRPQLLERGGVERGVLEQGRRDCVELVAVGVEDVAGAGDRNEQETIAGKVRIDPVWVVVECEQRQDPTPGVDEIQFGAGGGQGGL